MNSAVAATKSAIRAFGDACRAETRDSIAAWIGELPARMEAQAKAGSTTTHYLYEAGKRNAAALILEGIQRLADLEERKR